MVTVTFKVQNAPAKADHFNVSCGANTPYSQYQLYWTGLGSAVIGSSLTGQVPDDARYVRVRTFIAGVPGDLYQGETTTPTVFESGKIYTFNCTTNSLGGEAPLPPSVNFIDDILSAVTSIGDWFHDAYLVVNDWVWPFNLLANILFYIFFGFRLLLNPLISFGAWVDDVVYKVTNIIGLGDIVGLLRSWLTMAENAWAWIQDAWLIIPNIINSWWSSASQTVLIWVNEAKQYAATLFNNVSAMVLNLQAAWDSFKDKLPTLDEVVRWWSNWAGNVTAAITTWWSGALKDVQGLINSAFTAREGLWAGWQDWRAQVAGFFEDPEQWVYDRLDSFFERFW